MILFVFCSNPALNLVLHFRYSLYGEQRIVIHGNLALNVMLVDLIFMSGIDADNKVSLTKCIVRNREINLQDISVIT